MFPYTQLIAALIMVESSGNDQAVGVNGKSFGPLQITDICREDVNRFAKTSYTREDCFDRAKAIEMFKLYIGHYCTLRSLGHEPTLEDAARIWNGGPDGWWKGSTVSYFFKVRKELRKQGAMVGGLK